MKTSLSWISLNPLRGKTTSRRGFLAGLLLAALACSLPAAQAAATWTGGNGTEFTTPDNWVGLAGPGTSPYDGIVMSGSNGTVTFSANATFTHSTGTAALLFDATTATSFTLSGSQLLLAGNPAILNTSGKLQTIINNLRLSSAATLSTSGTGSNLTFTGAINKQGNSLSLVSTNSGILEVDGVISGDGTQLFDSNTTTAGVTLVTGNNTFTGAVAIYTNTVKVSQSTGLGSNSAIQFAGSTGNYKPTLLTNGAITLSQTINLISTGNNTVNTNTLGGASADASTFSGPINMSWVSGFNTAEGVTVTAVAGGQVNFTGGFIRGATATGTRDVLTKTGAGIVQISGSSTYEGATLVNAGTLRAGVASVANVSGAFGKNSAVTMANVAGATLDLAGFATQIGSLTGGGATGGNVTLGTATLTTGGDNTSPGAYAGVISGTGGLTKIGSGTQTLSGNNTYAGATTISAGTLLLTSTGSISNSSGVNLGTSGSQGTLNLTSKASYDFGAGQTVSGFGTINIGTGKTVTIAHLAPGNSPGQVSVTGSLIITTDTTMELAGSGGVKGTDFDNTTATEALTYGGTLSIVSFGGFNINQVGTYSLFDFASQSGNFSGVSVGGTALVSGASVWTGSNSGFDYSFALATGDLTVIPEPVTWALLAATGTFFMVMRRRRRRD